jgi:hypothetical protein
MFDEPLDRVSIYAGFKREPESFSVIRSEKAQESGISGTKPYLCRGSQMRSPALVIEDVAMLECGNPQGAILIGPRGEVQMLFRDRRHLISLIGLALAG